jgi:hypothetical protein
MPLDFHGMDLTSVVNRLRAGFAQFCSNVRAYVKGGWVPRNPQTGPLFTPPPGIGPIHSIRRLNDTSPNGPAQGYAIIFGAGTNLYLWNGGSVITVATGLSGNPLSLLPFRPNASPQPWMYVADSNKMLKVRSDGTCWKMGVAEPQQPPTVTTTSGTKTTTGTLAATAIPWTNYQGQNPNYDYGELYGPPNPGSPNPIDGTAPFIVDCANATSITITGLSGSATINGGPKAPTSAGPTPGSTNPGGYAQTAGSSTPPGSVSVVVGSFTDGSGNVIAAGVAPLYVPSVVDVGSAFSGALNIQVPANAQAFQIGINSTGDTFNSNSGSFAITVTVTTDALPAYAGVLGQLTLAYFGDSPGTGPVGSYLWKNPGDPGGGIPRSTSNANGTTTGNSFIFDSTITAGIPGLPGTGTNAIPMQWASLSPESAIVGTAPIFPSPLTTTYPTQTEYANFNFCLYGSIYIPAAGDYTLVLTSHDDCIIGLQSAILISSTASGSGEGGGVGLSNEGQTISVAMGYPLFPRQNYTSANNGNYAQTTIVARYGAAGIYGIEIDFDYFARSGRIMLLEMSPTPGANPTILPPLTQSVRQSVSYEGRYRSTATGAKSNPSPASPPQTVPTLANTISVPWSPDPQVDVVDYFRIDSAVSSYTYVCTGPNTNPPTAVTDSLTDLELGTELIEEDNFEPFPTIDLPWTGTVNVSGGVLTWATGHKFNIRLLPDNSILIGSPTSLAYDTYNRPTPAAWQAGYRPSVTEIILDGLGHYQQAITVTGPTGPSAPSFNDLGGATTDGGVTWQDQGTYDPFLNGLVTQMFIPGVPDGNGQAYEITEPELAAQCMPIMFGITDNIVFAYALGDPLRRGVLYWCAGGNLDAAPDTNQEDVVSGSEVLVGGAMSSGRGVLMSDLRGWTILPNFFNALATATGTQGSTWTLQASSITRGLYMPWCIAVEGGGNVFVRVKDGIDISPGGQGSKSITDDELYPLFPHENAAPPVPIVRGIQTIYPPDDTQPDAQRFSIADGYLYYDYVGTDDEPHTLVFDIRAMGWVWDTYAVPATVHALEEGIGVNATLVGCSDGSVRQLSASGTEAMTSMVLTPAIGGVGFCHVREISLEYWATSSITLSPFAIDTGNGSIAPPGIVIPAAGSQQLPAKLKVEVGPNKWKLLCFQFSSTGPYEVMIEGFACKIASWGSEEYKPVLPFGGEQAGGSY